MAKEKKEPATSAADRLADKNIGERCTIDGATFVRIPGGFVVLIGSTSCFAPLTDFACAELGIALEQPQ